MANHKVHCWCGMILNPKRLHYPGNNPENGPAHHPKPPCPECGHEPHSGPCFPFCSCASPSPRLYDDRDPEHPDHWIILCTSCGCEIEGAEPTPLTFDPMGLKSEHIPLALLRSNGHSNIGSALAVAVQRWLNKEVPK